VLLAAVASWIARFAGLAVAFLLTPFVLHRLGDTQYGLFVLVGAVIGQGALLDFGIGSAIIKYVAEHQAQGQNDRLSGLLATALFIYCGLGVIALLLTSAIAPFFPDLFNVPTSDRSTTIIITWLAGIRLAISIPCTTSSAILWGLHRYALANALNVATTLASALATVAILLLGGGLVALVAANIPLTLGMQAITIWCVHRVMPELRLGWRGVRRDLMKRLLSFSASMFATDIAYNFQTKSDEIIIGAFLPVSFVSPYAISRRLGGVPQLVGEQALSGFIPISSELHAKGDAGRLRSLYLVGSRVTLAICVPLAAALTALAGPLLTLWVGAEYAAHAPIVVILALASVAEISHWPGQSILQGLGRHHGLAIAYVCAAIGKLVISLLLVRSWGLTGIAFATLISAAALSLIYVFPYTMRTLHVSLLDILRQVLLPATLPLVPMLAGLYLIEWALHPAGLLQVGWTALAGLTIYAAVYLPLCAGEAERELVRSFTNKVIGTVSPLFT
jgi:O-antigen/teichoic acid export membrane protein